MFGSQDGSANQVLTAGQDQAVGRLAWWRRAATYLIACGQQTTTCYLLGSCLHLCLLRVCDVGGEISDFGVVGTINLRWCKQGYILLSLWKRHVKIIRSQSSMDLHVVHVLRCTSFQTWDLPKSLHDWKFQGKKFTQKTHNFRHLLNRDKKCVNALNWDKTSKKCS